VSVRVQPEAMTAHERRRTEAARAVVALARFIDYGSRTALHNAGAAWAGVSLARFYADCRRAAKGQRVLPVRAGGYGSRTIPKEARRFLPKIRPRYGGQRPSYERFVAKCEAAGVEVCSFCTFRRILRQLPVTRKSRTNQTRRETT